MSTLVATEQASAVQSDASTQAMQTLTAQWYNALITGLGLSDQQFQLFQGPGSTPATSQIMWNLFNAVPPNTVNNYYGSSQANNFASDYDLILSALVTVSDSDFQNCMGDYYGQWQTDFKAAYTADPTIISNATALSKFFQGWAIVNAPSQASCVSGLTKTYINPISIANNMYDSADGKYAWNQTIDALQKALASGPSKSFSMNSQTASSNITHSWASGGTSIFFDLFSFGGSGGYDNLSTKATSAGLNISAKYQKVATFVSGPYASPDPNNPILAKYNPWYDSAVLAKAYTTQDNTVWNNQSSVTWQKAFGPSGFLQRMATAMVVADGIDITITSIASFSSLEQTQITAAAKVGIWPFFSASGQGGYTNTVTFNDQGQFTSVTHSVLGNPQIIGILQSSMADIFS
jgi:hypothetical protein